MPKLGAVTPGPEPINPFKNAAPSAIGVVAESVVNVPASQPPPKLGVINQVPSPVVTVGMKPAETIGTVAPSITPAPAPLPSAPPVGVAQAEPLPLFSPPTGPKPNLGASVDVSVTPVRQNAEEEVLPPPPIAHQPVVIDPFKKD